MGIEKEKSQLGFGFGFGFVLQLIWFQGLHKFGDWNPWFSGEDKKVMFRLRLWSWLVLET